MYTVVLCFISRKYNYREFLPLLKSSVEILMKIQVRVIKRISPYDEKYLYVNACVYERI